MGENVFDVYKHPSNWKIHFFPAIYSYLMSFCLPCLVVESTLTHIRQLASMWNRWFESEAIQVSSFGTSATVRSEQNVLRLILIFGKISFPKQKYKIIPTFPWNLSS